MHLTEAGYSLQGQEVRFTIEQFPASGVLVVDLLSSDNGPYQ
jgi:hypothetical protein